MSMVLMPMLAVRTPRYQRDVLPRCKGGSRFPTTFLMTWRATVPQNPMAHRA